MESLTTFIKQHRHGFSIMVGFAVLFITISLSGGVSGHDQAASLSNFLKATSLSGHAFLEFDSEYESYERTPSLKSDAGFTLDNDIMLLLATPSGDYRLGGLDSPEAISGYTEVEGRFTSEDTFYVDRIIRTEDGSDSEKGGKEGSIGAPKTAVGDWNVLFMFLRPSDLTNTPYPATPSEVAGKVGGILEQGTEFMSYDRLDVHIDTTDWFEIDIPEDEYCVSTINDDGLHQQVIADEIAEQGIDLSPYDGLLVFTQCGGNSLRFGAGSHGKRPFWVGDTMYDIAIGTMFMNPQGFADAISGPPYMYLRISDTMRYIEHEFGHMLGALHAKGLECLEDVISPDLDDCYVQEYGNYFDSMGVGGHARQFNANAKYLLGWIDDSEILSITQDGEYTVESMNRFSSDPKVAYIYTPNGEDKAFMIEYRMLQGFRDPDISLIRTNLIGNMRGIFVYKFIDGVPVLLDAQPGSGPIGPLGTDDFDRVALVRVDDNDGALTITDPDTGIVIGPVYSAGNNMATFEVTYPEFVSCAPGGPVPLEVIAASKIQFATNTRLNFTFRVENTSSASCSSSSVSVAGALVDEYADVYQTIQYTSTTPISPGDTGLVSLQLNVPGTVPAGSYHVSVQTIDSVTGLVGEATLPFTVQ